MALPEFSLRQLLEAGVHYGHQTQRWNPRMGEYIYGERNGIHIMDLTQTLPMLDAALQVVRDGVGNPTDLTGPRPLTWLLPSGELRQDCEEQGTSVTDGRVDGHRKQRGQNSESANCDFLRHVSMRR